MKVRVEEGNEEEADKKEVKPTEKKKTKKRSQATIEGNNNEIGLGSSCSSSCNGETAGN